MKIWQFILLGIVQGVAEFLPISSSGHLVLMEKLMGISSPGIFLEVMLHIGTLVAVCVYYRETLAKLIRHPINPYVGYLILATIPSVLFTLLFGDWIDAAFGGNFLGISFLVTALLLMLASRIPRGQKDIRSTTPLDAICIGLSQCIALFPGVSRSGATITGALFRGLKDDFAAEFSFLMSIPAILGSLVLQIVDIARWELLIGDIQWGGTVLGMVFAALFGYLAISGMLRLLKKGKLHIFAIYTGALGLLVLVDQYITHLVF